jgi:hypothetical protein
MTDKHPKRARDPNQLAKAIVDIRPIKARQFTPAGFSLAGWDANARSRISSGFVGMMNDEVLDTHGQFTASALRPPNNSAAKVFYVLGATSSKGGKA